MTVSSAISPHSLCISLDTPGEVSIVTIAAQFTTRNKETSKRATHSLGYKTKVGERGSLLGGEGLS